MTPGRLVGLDVARCLALLGMMATHVLDARTPEGDLTFAQAVAGGRAAALFAVLAGVSLALVSGRSEPLRGRDQRRAVLGQACRAGLIGALGLLLGALETSIAIILTYYAVLFLLALPFLGLRAGTLAALAAAWAVAAPVASHVVRPALPERGFESPHPAQLADPVQLVTELLFTGYYPAVPWLAYLLAGMAVGRTDLGRARLPLALAIGGGLLAIAAWAASWVFLGRAGVRAALFPASPGLSRDEVADRLADGLAGTTPTGGAEEWLLVAAPHSATPFDLAHTTGTAILVIGVCLLLVRVLPEPARLVAAVFFGAGTMTLTLYSLHVVMRTPDVWPAEEPDTYVWHVLVVLAVGAAYAAVGRRGPLEQLVGAPARALRGRTGAGPPPG